MGILKWFRKKKEITPKILNEMMECLREDIKTTLAIEDPAEKEAAVKLMLKRVEEDKKGRVLRSKQTKKSIH